MSTKYQNSKDVPTDALIQRLNELSDAITGGRESQDREFTMRIPAECDRDADLVIGESASRLGLLKSEVERLRGRCGELEHLIRYAQVESGVCMCGDEIEAHNQASGHSPVDIWDNASEKALEGTSDAWLLRKQAEAVLRAEGECRRISIDGFYCWGDSLNQYAQRLRQQADELEEANED